MESHCGLCTEPILPRAVFTCEHAVCWRCALRMRVLMKDMQCPYCRDESATISVLSSLSGSRDAAKLSLRQTILCETHEIKHKLQHLLSMPCPKCDKESSNYNDLKSHISAEHNQTLCNVCTRFESKFADEYESYSNKELSKHLQKVHEYCTFCQWYFYSRDELAKHCKTQHESCFICEKRDPLHPQYFSNYDNLEDHFRKDHFACPIKECVEQKFVVFADKVELQAHMYSNHKDMVRNARDLTKIMPEDWATTRHSNRRVVRIDESPDTGESDRELAEKRYNERLKIETSHNKEKISSIQKANTTFATKPVPVEVFVSTYSSVLDTSDEQITALLREFSNFSILEPGKLTSLKNVVAQRENRANAEAFQKAKQSVALPSLPSRATVASTWADRSRGASASPNWQDNLPRLGTNKKRPGFMSTPTAAITVARPAPRPTSKSPSPAPSRPVRSTINITPGPQTSMPALGSRSDRQRIKDELAESWDLQNGSPSAQVSRAASPSASSSAGPTPSTSSTSLWALDEPTRPNRLRANLPSLPKKSEAKKSDKAARVLRIV